MPHIIQTVIDRHVFPALSAVELKYLYSEKHSVKQDPHTVLK